MTSKGKGKEKGKENSSIMLEVVIFFVLLVLTKAMTIGYFIFLRLLHRYFDIKLPFFFSFSELRFVHSNACNLQFWAYYCQQHAHGYGIIFKVTESVKRHVEGQKTSRGNSSPNKNKFVGLPTTKSCHQDFRCGSLVFRSKDTLYFSSSHTRYYS